MKIFIAFVKKEFYHIFRDSRTMLVILGMPIVQILLFGFAINMEVQDIRVAVYDPTPDATTSGIVERINQNPYFNMQENVHSIYDIEESMRKGKLDLAVVFLKNIGRVLPREELMLRIWARDTEVDTRTVDTHTSRLRKKLGLNGESGMVLTSVYGQGYRLDPVSQG